MIVMTLRPSEPLVDGVPRVLVDVDYLNSSERALDLSTLEFADCNYGSGILRITTEKMEPVDYVGMSVDREPGYSPPKSGKWLCPGASLTVSGVDITNLYDYPREPRTLRFQYKTAVGDGIGVSAPSVELRFSPISEASKGKRKQQRIARTEVRAGRQTIVCSP